MKINKKKLYTLFAILIVALLPSAVFASVIINESYSASTQPVTNPFQLTHGPNYATANSLSFTTLKNGTTSTTNTITLGYLDNVNSVELVDVLEIQNHSSVKKPTYISLSVSSTSNVAFYYSLAPITVTYPTTSDLGTQINTSQIYIHMMPGTVIYLSAEINGSVTTPVTLTMTSSIS